MVWVEGLIGAGKTTLTKALAEKLDYREVLEPVNDNAYLDLFYTDQKRWAFSMQMDMLFRRWELHQLATFEVLTGRGAILDRGIPGDMVFAQMHFEAGNIHKVEWETYLRMYRGLMSRVSFIPRILVYLDVDPEVALSRVTRRARNAEVGMTLDYLQNLRQMYHRLLEKIEAGAHGWASGVKVVRVDWNYDGVVVEPVVDAVCGALAP
jgi:deoxyadenosine/deoxycytidine kinase